MIYMTKNQKALFTQFSPLFEEKLAPFTTWKIGGPAEVLIKAKTVEDLEKVVQICLENGIEYTILGNGSNILISDNGIRGVVLINQSKEIRPVGLLENCIDTPKVSSRHQTENKNFYVFDDLDFQESGFRQVVEIDSGVMLGVAIGKTLKEGLTGLQWFSGIPGTIGGSLYNNIHGGSHHFSEYFYQAKIVDEDGEVKTVGVDFFNFGYDKSILREKKIVVLTVSLALFQGDEEQVKKANFTAREWAIRKRSQPKNSCGSVFQSLSPQVQKDLKLPTSAVGYIVDKILNLKGESRGDAQIYSNHGNFIINNGKAKASEVLELIKLVILQTKMKMGVEIYPEINFLGFSPFELEGIKKF